ncbi:MAG: sigma-70 family RNA polymerase sigma factor [Bryobacteraceae bacterium]
MNADPSAEASAGPVATNWLELVIRIRNCDDSGMEELYRLFSRGVRFYLYRHLGTQDLDDRIHDTFVIVVQAIRNGELREPERLMGFVRTVVRRQVAAHIDRAVQQRKEHTDIEQTGPISDQRNDPERSAIDKEHEKVVESVLLSVSARDREILTRFYLKEQTQEEICKEMNLSETQFRLLKSRAKARFAEVGRRKLGRRKNV